MKKLVRIFSIIILFLGFNSTLLSEDLDNLMDLSLEELLNVKITTAGKQAQKISDIPASVQIISREDIKSYGYRDMQELLENTLGVYITDEKNTYDVGINVRGFWSTQPSNIVILLNGVPQVEDRFNTYGLRLIRIPIETVERIEIVRGPLAVVYGSGSFFGAINIITESTGKETDISFKAGSLSDKEFAARINASTQDLKFTLIAGVEKSNGDEFEFDKVISDLTKFPNLKGQINKDGFKHDSKYFNLNASTMGFFTQITHTNYKDGYQIIFPPSPQTTSEHIGKQTIATIGYTGEINDWLSMNLSCSYYDAQLERRSLFNPYVNSLLPGELNDQSESFLFDLNLFLNPIEKLDLTLGFSQKRITHNYSIGNISAVNIINKFGRLSDSSEAVRNAFFAQGSYKINNDLSVLFGFRLEQENPYDIATINSPLSANEFKVFKTVPTSDMLFIPRAAIIYKANPQNIFKLMYGKAVKLPAIQQNVDVLESNLGNGTNNPFLKNEEINTFELNYQGALTSKIQVNGSLFYNNMKNIIIRNYAIVNNKTVVYIGNQGKLNSIGGEFAFIYRPFDRLHIELSGMYQKSKNVDLDTVDVAHSPNFLGYAKIKYNITSFEPKTLYNFSIALTANYVDKMLADWNSNSNSRIGAEAKAYTLLGVNLVAENIFIPQIYANLRISNLLDQEYTYANSANADWATLGMPGRGRFVRFSLGYVFENK